MLLVLAPFDRPHMISCYSSIVAMSLTYTVTKILSLWKLEGSHDLYVTFGGNLSHVC